MKRFMIVLSIFLLFTCLNAQNSTQFSENDEFEYFMKGLFEVAVDGSRLSELLPCRNAFSEQTNNFAYFIQILNQPLEFNKLVSVIDSLAPISDSFGIILTHCLPCFKQIDTIVDEIRTIINTDYDSFVKFLIDSLKRNYLQLAKEAVEIYDLRSKERA